MEMALRERVIVIVGPLSTTVQSLLSVLTSHGADVALLDPDAQKAEKFCSQLTDQREVNPKHGRAIAVSVDLSNLSQIQDRVGQVAQSFGGVDVLLDAQLSNSPSPVRLEAAELTADVETLDKMIARNLRPTILCTLAMANFLKGRKKGRLVYLIHDSLMKASPEDALASAVRGGIVPFALATAKQMQEHNVTVNVLSLGLTEEYLVGHGPGLVIKDALEKQKRQDPQARITEPDKIANSLIFLLGPSGAAVTGQILRLN